jgi:hypothetical protein
MQRPSKDLDPTNSTPAFHNQDQTADNVDHDAQTEDGGQQEGDDKSQEMDEKQGEEGEKTVQLRPLDEMADKINEEHLFEINISDDEDNNELQSPEKRNLSMARNSL